ncbi:MAG: hypothetical protein D6797_06605 [Bdellovibrio sp.]|nr:MAG: hypothetical protein D6797_06605 [Bdellovibrio sp.]
MRAKKPFTDVINFFKFKGHGEVKIDVKSPQDNLDIPVNQQSYKSHFSVKAPFFSKEKNFFVSVALSSIKEVPGEMTFLPTDLKKIEPGQTLQLTALDEDKKASYALSALVPNQTTQQCEKLKQEIQQFFSDLDRSRKVNNPFDDEFFFDDEFGDEEEGGLPDLGLGDFKGFCLKDRAFSVVFGPVSDVRFSAPNFLSLIPEPQVKGNQILLTPPSSAPQGIHPFATLLVLSEIEDVQKGKYKLEIKHRKWEVMAKGWVDRISLPDMTSLIAPNKKKTWEVIFLGSPDPTDKDVWNRDLSKVTHATRNSYRND